MQRSNLQSFCRTCLAHIDSTISSNYRINDTLTKLLIICTSINDDANDVYPQRLCEKCYDTLEQFRMFREMAQQSEEMLRKIVDEDIDENPGGETIEMKCFTEYSDTTVDFGESSMVSVGAESFLDPLLQTESGDCNAECEVPVKKRKMKSISWSFVKEYDNRIEAEEALKEEKTWSLNYSNHTIEGQKRFFRCNKVKKRGIQCSAKIYLLYDSTSNAVFMYRADADHDHDNKNLSSWSVMSDAVKLEIKKLFDRNMKPRFIINNLARMDNIQMPKMCQVRSYVRDLRRARCNGSSAEINQLEMKALLEANNATIKQRCVGENPNSETDSNLKDEVPPKKKKKEPQPISWSFVKTSLNYSEAEEALKEENTWSIEYSHNTKEGQKIFFRCNKFKKRGQCSAKVYLLLDSVSDSVSLYRADADHDHENKNSTSKHGLSEYVKLEINKLYFLDMRPKDIIDCLSKIKGIKLPKVSQLRNYLRDLREEIRHANILPECSTSSIGIDCIDISQRGNRTIETSDVDNSTTSSTEVKGFINPESGIIEAIREKKWKSIPWVFDRKCFNINEAEKVLRNENTWSIDYNRSTEEGHKKFYRCNKVKRRAIQCSAKVYLLFDSTSESVSLYRADAEHDHDQKELNSTYGLSEDVKVEINKLFDLDMKPRDIFDRLSLVEGIKTPKISQIRNYISDRRRRTMGYLKA